MQVWKGFTRRYAYTSINQLEGVSAALCMCTEIHSDVGGGGVGVGVDVGVDKQRGNGSKKSKGNENEGEENSDDRNNNNNNNNNNKNKNKNNNNGEIRHGDGDNNNSNNNSSNNTDDNNNDNDNNDNASGSKKSGCGNLTIACINSYWDRKAQMTQIELMKVRAGTHRESVSVEGKLLFEEHKRDRFVYCVCVCVRCVVLCCVWLFVWLWYGSHAHQSNNIHCFVCLSLLLSLSPFHLLSHYLPLSLSYHHTV